MWENIVYYRSSVKNQQLFLFFYFAKIILIFQYNKTNLYSVWIHQFICNLNFWLKSISLNYNASSPLRRSDHYPTGTVSQTQFCESKLNTVCGVQAWTQGLRALSQWIYLWGSWWGNMVWPWSTLSCVHGFVEVCTSGVHVCLAWLQTMWEEQLETHAWPHTSQWMYLVLSLG